MLSLLIILIFIAIVALGFVENIAMTIVFLITVGIACWRTFRIERSNKQRNVRRKNHENKQYKQNV